MKLRSLSDLEQLLSEQEKKSARTAEQPNNLSFRHDGKGKPVRVFLDSKGRGGKTVTVVSGLQHNPATMEEIAQYLKKQCGAGGTVKGGNIEIQGSQKNRVAEILLQLHYVIA